MSWSAYFSCPYMLILAIYCQFSYIHIHTAAYHFLCHTIPPDTTNQNLPVAWAFARTYDVIPCYFLDPAWPKQGGEVVYSHDISNIFSSTSSIFIHASHSYANNTESRCSFMFIWRLIHVAKLKSSYQTKIYFNTKPHHAVIPSSDCI